MKLIDLNALKYFYANLVEVLKGKADVADTNAHISDKSNPHEVTKTQVGLSKVENKSSEDIRGEITSDNVTDALGYTPLDAVGVQLNGKDLAKDSNNKINIAVDSYTKAETDAKLAKKEDNILSFNTWADYEKVKNTIPADTYFVVKEDEQANPIPSHNSLMNRDANECHPIKSITGLQAELDKKTDVTDTAVLKARVDQLVGEVPPGSADEIADARVMIDGKTSQNLGDAIRTQVSGLKETIDSNFSDLKSDIDGFGGIENNSVPLSIGVSGVWQLADTSTHIAIPVESGDKIVLSSNKNYMTIYAVLTEHNDVYNKAAAFSADSSWNSRKTLAKGSVSDELVMPSDAKYLYLCTAVNDNVYFPTSVRINGVERTYNIRYKIDKTIEQLNDVKESDMRYRKAFAPDDNIDAITDIGFYNISASSANRPSGTFPSGDDFTNAKMMLINYTISGIRLCQTIVGKNGKTASRMFVDGVWTSWYVFTEYDEIHTALESEINKTVKYNGGLTNADNIDTVSITGYYSISAVAANRPLGTYPNDESFVGSKLMFLNYPTGTTRLCQIMINKSTKVAVRMFVDGAWTAWNVIGTDKSIIPSDTVPFEYANVENTSTINNEGKQINVLSYNVGCYSNGNTKDKGISDNIFDEKVFNIKKFIMSVNADVMGLQEDTSYIDKAQTKDAHNWLYKPIYPNKSTLGGVSVYSKRELIASGSRPVGNGRCMAWFKNSIDNKILLFISIHPSVDTSEHRSEELLSLFTWISGQEYDWCVISGDFNTIEPTDRITLKQLCATYGFTMANGEYLGWLKTTPTPLSIDNILVSSNCIINSVVVHSSKYEELHSDHYPISANITLYDV